LAVSTSLGGDLGDIYRDLANGFRMLDGGCPDADAISH
jgi:hypothetical protein